MMSLSVDGLNKSSSSIPRSRRVSLKPFDDLEQIKRFASLNGLPIYEDDFSVITSQYLVIKAYYFPSGLSVKIPWNTILRISFFNHPFKNEFPVAKWGSTSDKCWWAKDDLRKSRLNRRHEYVRIRCAAVTFDRGFSCEDIKLFSEALLNAKIQILINMKWALMSTLRLRTFFVLNRNYIAYISKLALAFSLIFIFLFIAFASRSTDVSLEYKHYRMLGEPDLSKSCFVPVLDPWDPSILKYFSKPDPLICKPVQEPVVDLIDGHLKFDQNYVKGRVCYWRDFHHNDGVSDFDVVYGDQNYLNFAESGYTIPVDSEFVEVVCKTDSFLGTEIFRMHFAQIPTKTFSNVSGTQKMIENSSAEHPAVVMIGLDSMSRNNFMRQLPLTHSTMKRLGFQDMLGHVKIGDNTYANWIAILTGKRGVTTKEFDAEIDENWGICFDDLDIIWKNFSANNYVTLFAEDRPDIGTFNYFGYLCGFKNTPVDHYFRPYWLASYWSFAALRSTPYCYDSRGKHEIQLKYLEEFVRKYHGKRHFSYWWIQDMNHDYLNLIGKTDEDFNSFLISNERFFDEAIVIVFSDHGHRYDAIRETIVGRMEARLPYLSIRVPPKIASKYKNLLGTLKENSAKLTTQFDLYQTLLGIANGDLKNSPTGKISRKRSYSLFHPTPEIRHCFEANIPEDYCPCFTELSINLDEATVPASVFLNSMNDMILRGADALYVNSEDEMSQKYCARLELLSIEEATIRFPSPHIVHDVQTGGELPANGLYIQYRIVIKAKAPSNGLFEGIVTKNLKTGVWTTGEIERNNRYGNSSDCVTDRILKKLCHCLSYN
ncbi:unnamed protein product [Auanema sp. JU1783]|nr:unnamed protein product [Auanema sp. JU1783]